MDSRGMNSRRALKRAWILAGIGYDSADISDFGQNVVTFYDPNFGTMVTPALVMYGDEDSSPYLTTRGADWHADPYALALGPNDLLTLEGAKHGLGGISGWDAGETLDESPERLAVVQRLTWAYLSSQLFDGGSASVEGCRALEGLEVLGKVESKRMPTMHEVFAWMLDGDEE